VKAEPDCGPRDRCAESPANKIEASKSETDAVARQRRDDDDENRDCGDDHRPCRMPAVKPGGWPACRLRRGSRREPAIDEPGKSDASDDRGQYAPDEKIALLALCPRLARRCSGCRIKAKQLVTCRLREQLAPSSLACGPESRPITIALVSPQVGLVPELGSVARTDSVPGVGPAPCVWLLREPALTRLRFGWSFRQV
jgi:hypothetical protein